ncbi:MAG: hypothetical protein K6T78_08155 [Alicyclobacillus sp.]|nr:hypothetical protein [Alicyclobacillus sp.]
MSKRVCYAIRLGEHIVTDYKFEKFGDTSKLDHITLRLAPPDLQALAAELACDNVCDPYLNDEKALAIAHAIGATVVRITREQVVAYRQEPLEVGDA